MAGLQAGTILLLTLWSLWLLVALPLLGLERGSAGLLVVFVPLGGLLVLATPVTWRGYLMAWLAVHMLLAVLMVIVEKDWRQIGAAVVSLVGLLWLWGGGGWQYGHYVATAMLLLVAAAGLAGLGFGCCWLLVARPLGQRADDAIREAARVKRSLANTDNQLAERQAAEAASNMRIRALEEDRRVRQARQARQEEYEQDREAWERARRRLIAALQEERRYRDLQHCAESRGTESIGEQSDDSDNGTVQGAGADEVTVIRLGFSYLAEPSSARSISPGRRAYRPLASDQIRLVIEHSVVTMPRDQAGDVDKVLGQARQARGDVAFRERFVDAASQYAADRIGNSTFPPLTQRWRTQDPAHVDAVAQALNRSDEWLHDLAGKPFQDAAAGLGVSQPVDAVLGGIGSNLVLQPLDREIQGAVRFCEVVGIGVGLVFGLHPLAISCTKSLVRGGINEGLSTAIKEVFVDRDTITVERASPQPERLQGIALPQPWKQLRRVEFPQPAAPSPAPERPRPAVPARPAVPSPPRRAVPSPATGPRRAEPPGGPARGPIRPL